MLLPCYYQVSASHYRVITMLLLMITMLLPSYFYVITMLLPCYYRVLTRLLLVLTGLLLVVASCC